MVSRSSSEQARARGARVFALRLSALCRLFVCDSSSFSYSSTEVNYRHFRWLEVAYIASSAGLLPSPSLVDGHLIDLHDNIRAYVPSKGASRILGVHPQTLRAWAREGRINYIRTEGNQRGYDFDSYIGNAKPTITACYCRVSSKKRSADLDRQVTFM